MSEGFHTDILRYWKSIFGARCCEIVYQQHIISPRTTSHTPFKPQNLMEEELGDQKFFLLEVVLH